MMSNKLQSTWIKFIKLDWTLMKFICIYPLCYAPLCATTCHYASLCATTHPMYLYAPLHSVCFCLHSAGLIRPEESDFVPSWGTKGLINCDIGGNCDLQATSMVKRVDMFSYL